MLSKAPTLRKTVWPVTLAPIATLLVLNSACTIATYRTGDPARQPLLETPSKKSDVLTFSYILEPRGTLESDPQKIPWYSQVLRDHLERYSGFMKAMVTSHAPAIGTHINVYQMVGPHSSPWCTASNWSVGIIPCYWEGVIYEMHFDVLVDNIPKHSYRYPIHRKAVNWIVLIPLFWVNFLTTPYEEAFAGNIDQFIAEAKRDGFL